MTTLRETRQRIEADPSNGVFALRDLVDDFRHYRNDSVVAQSFEPDNEKFDALLAATAHYLCDELKIATPHWILEIPVRKAPLVCLGLGKPSPWWKVRCSFACAKFSFWKIF